MSHERIAIVGGGPAGIAGAIWARRLDLDPIVFERDAELGGQLRQMTLPIPDLPGLPDISGRALAMRLAQHLAALGIPVVRGAEAVGYAERWLRLAGGGRERVDVVVLAPGLRPRTLAVPGAESVPAVSASVLISAPPPGRVLVVGGGDRGAEAASRLAEAGIATRIVHRGRRLSARPAFQTRLRASGAEVWLESSVEEIRPHRDGFQVRLRRGDGVEVAEVSRILIRIGMESAVSPEWERVQTAAPQRVRIVGDAAQPAPYRSVVTAFGSAMVALKGIALDPPREEADD